MSDEPKLTADEIEELDALTTLQAGANRTLAVALNFHANRTSGLRDDWRRFWDGVKVRLDLDDDCIYKAERRRGHVRVVEVDADELEHLKRTDPFGGGWPT